MCWGGPPLWGSPGWDLFDGGGPFLLFVSALFTSSCTLLPLTTHAFLFWKWTGVRCGYVYIVVLSVGVFAEFETELQCQGSECIRFHSQIKHLIMSQKSCLHFNEVYLWAFDTEKWKHEMVWTIIIISYESIVQPGYQSRCFSLPWYHDHHLHPSGLSILVSDVCVVFAFTVKFYISGHLADAFIQGDLQRLILVLSSD